MTPERERFLHKHIFVGEERSLCEVKVFNPRERRLPRHGCDHPIEPLVHLASFRHRTQHQPDEEVLPQVAHAFQSLQTVENSYQVPQ